MTFPTVRHTAGRRVRIGGFKLPAAAALGVAGRAGVLRSGAAADLVELDRDPVGSDPGRITGIRVTGTRRAGRRTACPTPDRGAGTRRP
ncbi:hypothetical protein [Polymorphospora rubra]|uniref:hypothetical protein n=1 Tax=Polymorphospora rubra TaxID=338584 RepID=UPI0033DFC80D